MYFNEGVAHAFYILHNLEAPCENETIKLS